jgi:Ni,Fe-hydrogenase III large subunit
MTTKGESLRLFNGESAPLAGVPELTADGFRRRVMEGVRSGERLASLGGLAAPVGRHGLLAVTADGAGGALNLFRTTVGASYESLTPDCPGAHLFERRLAERWGVVPEGHPWLKPVRFPAPAEAGRFEAYRVEGEEVHEVAVGPVHAGIIEPGHFRFQCHGERVLHLEIMLGYQHRGVERALVGGPGKRTVAYMETLAGDTTVGHATAYAQVMEALGGCRPSPRAEALRALALELERMANHVGDLGALAGDVGYLPTASFCGRLRGDLLNATAVLCGNRFGRGLVRPGGAGCGVDGARAKEVLDLVDRAMRDVAGAVALLWSTPSVMGRFEGTGALDRGTCLALGLVGVPARACGLDRDVRQEFPAGFYRFSQVPVSTWDSGDVFARAWVRWLETERSAEFVRRVLSGMPGGELRVEVAAPAPESVAVAMVEGWRGEICHVAVTGADGRFASYEVVDPSFHNWQGLAHAMRGQAISDFPLCNKSFNLSYCGHDL